MPGLAPERLEAELELPIDGRERDPEQVLAQLRRIVLATPRTSGPRFFNQLFAGRDPVAAAAEVLTGLLNVSMYTFKAAGPHALIEREIARVMCEKVGFAGGEGTSVPGGSIANLIGVLLGRNEADPDARDTGLDGRRMTVYISSEGHYSVRKAAGILGLGREQVRDVPVDDTGRMRPAALEFLVEHDRNQGFQPAVVVATSGTTVRGAFDPLRGVAGVARREKLWLHVDAAFGGTLLLHPERRALLDGSELADSFSWNAHKMMGVALSSSMLLVRRPGLLRKHFDESADYLFQSADDSLDLGKMSIQCGRRNDTFKLWAAWRVLGDRGWAERIDRQLALTAHAVQRVQQDPGLVLCEQPSSINTCFEVVGKCSAELCDALNREGLAQVGWGVVRGRRAIRLVTANPDLGLADIDRFFDDLLGLARDLGPGDNSVPPEARQGVTTRSPDSTRT